MHGGTDTSATNESDTDRVHRCTTATSEAAHPLTLLTAPVKYNYPEVT